VLGKLGLEKCRKIHNPPLGRLTAEFGHRVAQYIVDDRPLVARQALLQQRHPGADRFQRRLYWLGGDNTGNADLAGLFLAGEQDLMQTLAGANAGESDLDIPPGLEPAQPDDALGKVDDLHGLPHVEHVDKNVGTLRPQRVGWRRVNTTRTFTKPIVIIRVYIFPPEPPNRP